MKLFRRAWLAFAAIFALSLPGAAAEEARVLDDFDTVGAWTAVASDDVKASLRQITREGGKALCLDYDFNGVSGYAVARRNLPIDYPANYEYAIRLRGAGPANNLEFKLVDGSGENVWWVTRPNYVAADAWSLLKLKKRHISFAWGPSADKTLRRSAAFEIVVSAGKGGGRGEICFDDLSFRPLPADDAAPRKVQAAASATVPGSPAAAVVDGDASTAWRAAGGAQSIALDLGGLREFGGLTLRWRPDEHATRYLVQLSDDGRAWRDVRRVRAGNGGIDPIALPESEARWVRLKLERGATANYGLAELTVEELAFAATPNDFLKSVARSGTRGQFPRAFSGEQSYWTIVGVDGGREQGLIGEDGAIEVGKGGFSVEPFLLGEGSPITWANVQIAQSLAEDYLPIPTVEWTHPGVELRITAFAQGSLDSSQMVVRYRLRNTGTVARKLTLALAVRPLQVNPPSQFLNTVGGFSAIRRLTFSGRNVWVDDRTRIQASRAPSTHFATAFESGMVQEHLGLRVLPGTASVEDETGLASGAMLYPLHLDAGETGEIDLFIPLTGGMAEVEAFDAHSAQEAVAAQWREKLGRIRLQVPEQGKVLSDTLRTALAHMLISRAGPRLQPGTRSYARAWIRDGAMISEGLLRMGHAPVAEEFLRWYAPYQFASGKVPCCVDDRGSDPVPENDSQGEFIYTVAEVYRHTGDRRLLGDLWPRVHAAVRYMDQLRLGERAEGKPEANPAFYGLMPASISHEGYSAKPMHSYWDDFWALRGYKDALEIARWLGHSAEAERIAASRDQFRNDLYASLQIATKQHGIDFLPGAAELGDFDATSTTIALAPGGEQARLPQDLLRNTFERYWTEFVQRRDGKRAWEHYTPYELRNVGAFVRLGWRARAMQALDFFVADRQPAGWNQWAEVVAREPRKPFFLGDLPHAWVASDYVRSVLDMFAYTREFDQSMVIAAGIPSEWLDGEGIAIRDLHTPYGKLSYTLRRENGELKLQIAAGLQAPSGGVVLPWPAAGAPGQARVNGKTVAWQNGELRLRSFPADVRIEAQK